MKKQAIASCRVSTPDQRLNNSLNRQEQNVMMAAERLDADIVRWWSGDVSSKAGTNVNRADLKEMLEYCKFHKSVKYLIVDEPDRFMRSVDEAFYFEVLFRELGVKLWYASDELLNGDDLMSKLLKFSKYFPAEGSNVERQTKSVTGHEKALREGRYTFPIKPGYIKSQYAGIADPHPNHFEPLQKSLEDILSGVYSPLEALRRLNASKFTETHAAWRMDKFRAFVLDPYNAGVVEKNKQVKGRNENGRHKSMITLEEHYRLIEMLEGTVKLRGPKKHYNPAFQLSNLLWCEDCGPSHTYTGFEKNNGYDKKITRYYYKYRCSGCKREYHRDDIHSQVDNVLQKLSLDQTNLDKLLKALRIVWAERHKDKQADINRLEKDIVVLKERKSKLIITLSESQSSLKADIEETIDNVKESINTKQKEVKQLNSTDSELDAFIDFALSYGNELREDWWSLGREERKRCEQILFSGGISYGPSGKVRPHDISPIYRLALKEKESQKTHISHLVELPGTAPGSEK